MKINNLVGSGRGVGGGGGYYTELHGEKHRGARSVFASLMFWGNHGDAEARRVRLRSRRGESNRKGAKHARHILTIGTCCFKCNGTSAPQGRHLGSPGCSEAKPGDSKD